MITTKSHPNKTAVMHWLIWRFFACAVLTLFLSYLAILSKPARADRYYNLDMETAALAPGQLKEDGKVFRLRTEGGGATPRLTSDHLQRSTVLSLSSWSSPHGATRDRVELQISSAITFDRPWAIGLRFMQPFDDPILPGHWHLFMQCHQAGTQNPPPLSLNLEPGGLFSLVARSDADPFERLWTGPMPVARWLDLVLEFTMGDPGHVRMWINGQQVANTRVVLRWKEGEDRCTLKTGLYRGPSEAPFEMWFDDIRLGNRYRDVVR